MSRRTGTWRWRRAIGSIRARDLVGAALVVSAAAWAGLAAVGRPAADPSPVVALAAAALALATVGRWSAGRSLRTVPELVGVAVVGAFVLGYPDLTEAAGPPTRYANANATLAGLGAVAAASRAALAERRARSPWIGLTALALAALAGTGSVAGAVVVAVAAAVVGLALIARDRAVAVVGALVATILSIGVSVAIAAGSDPLGLTPRLDGRAELWARALDQLRDAPLRGVGPGRYGGLHPFSVDADLRWAHHGYLQQAAETGGPGLVLLLALVGWCAVALLRSEGTTVQVLGGSAALTIVGVHASVDHVLHAAAVPLTLALVVGWATAPRPAASGRRVSRPGEARVHAALRGDPGRAREA